MQIRIGKLLLIEFAKSEWCIDVRIILFTKKYQQK